MPPLANGANHHGVPSREAAIAEIEQQGKARQVTAQLDAQAPAQIAATTGTIAQHTNDATPAQPSPTDVELGEFGSFKKKGPRRPRPEPYAMSWIMDRRVDLAQRLMGTRYLLSHCRPSPDCGQRLLGNSNSHRRSIRASHIWCWHSCGKSVPMAAAHSSHRVGQS